MGPTIQWFDKDGEPKGPAVEVTHDEVLWEIELLPDPSDTSSDPQSP